MPQQKNPKTKKAALSTQQILNIRQFVPLHVNGDAYAIEGDDGRLYVYLMLRPDNISVLGRGEILSKIRNLQNIIENLPDMQTLCVSSTQSYENNKRYYRQLAKSARNPIISRLCLKEIEHMDEINISMSTSREFMFLLNFPAGQFEEARHGTMQAVQLIREQHYSVHIADKETLKRLFSIYYVGDIYSDSIPEKDGQQYAREEEYDDFA